MVRVALAGLALVSLLVIAVPMLATADVRQSQADASAGRLDQALDDAESAGARAVRGHPNLQRALVLEAQGNLGAAAAAARAATQEESTNWRNWLTLSRIEAERGQPPAAVAAYRTARSLNPRSGLFQLKVARSHDEVQRARSRQRRDPRSQARAGRA